MSVTIPSQLIEDIGARLHRLEGAIEAQGLAMNMQRRDLDSVKVAHREGLAARSRCFSRLERLEINLDEDRKHRETINCALTTYREDAECARLENRGLIEALGKTVVDQAERMNATLTMILQTNSSIQHEAQERYAEVTDKLAGDGW